MGEEADKHEHAEVDEHPRLIEPDEHADEAEAAAAPAVATPTKDPNRYTLYVPFDHSTFSMGQSGPAWIPDRGITAKTDNHMHFFVVGTAEPKDNTIVSIGGPATAHAVEAHVGSLSSGAIHGYAMVTSGNAWHDSKLQQVVMSRNEDVTVRTTGEAKAVGIQADEGKVLVFAKETVAMGSKESIKLGAHPDLKPTDIGYEAKWPAAMADNIGAKIGSTITTIGEVITSASAIALSQMDGIKKGVEGKAGWDWGPLASKPKMVADLALFASTYVRGAMEIIGLEPQGSIGISAQKFTSVTGGIGSTVYGGAAAALVSLGQAEVLGGLSALVKGLAWTEIASGVLTALTSVKNVEIGATNGEIGMTAKGEVLINSTTKAVLVTGMEVVQLASVDSHAFVHGHKGSYIGGGGANGFGAQFMPKEIRLGKAAHANEFEDPGFEPLNEIRIKDGVIGLKVETSSVALEKSAVTVKADKIKLEVSGVGMEITSSGKILLD
jgi:hypothetical protein